jgi:molybdopterin-guanine dinucleotide biosynthesis protein A
MGRNKLAEVVGGRTLLQRVVDTLSLFDSEIIIVASEASSFPDVTFPSEASIVRDIFPDKGTLGGIYTGLRASSSLYNIVVAADMPFLNADLLAYMRDIAVGMDLVAYREGERFEPLHAVYSRNCLVGLEEMLKLGSVRLIEILRFAKTHYLSLEEIDTFDPQHLSFFNVNLEEELRHAQQIVACGSRSS